MKLLVSDVIFLVSVTYVLRTTVVVKPVMLVIDFSISLLFVLVSVLLTTPLVLRIFLSMFLIFFQDSVCQNCIVL